MARTTGNEPPEPNIATQRTPPGVRQDPITDAEGVPQAPPPPPDRSDPDHDGVDEAAVGPEIDPTTLDEPEGEYMDRPTRIVALPIKGDGTPNTLGIRVEILEVVQDYRDVVKARVAGSADQLNHLAERSRTYFARAWDPSVGRAFAEQQMAEALARQTV